MEQSLKDKPKIWLELAEYARWAPTPHNTQPLRLKILNNTDAELYYDNSRALPEGDPQARFALTAVGIFTESLKIAAAGKGYELRYTYLKEDLNNRSNEKQLVAKLKLVSRADVKDIDMSLLMKRRTSRVEYNSQDLDPKAVKEIQEEARKFGHTFVITRDPPTVAWVNDLNQRMVFYDLDEDNVRNELAEWSRFTKSQAQKSRDGLSAECLNVPGWGLWLFMKHYGALKIPGIKQLLQWIYKKNITGITTVGWLQGKFFTIDDFLTSGHVLLRVWLLMAKHGIAYQPYGSVITNKQAHDEFKNHLKIDESVDMAWLLMRLGYSSEPPRSERLPLEEIII